MKHKLSTHVLLSVFSSGLALTSFVSFSHGSGDPLSNDSGSRAECPATTGDGQVGPPTTTALVAGSGQNARVNKAVASSLILQARDADGDAVPGVAVSFSVVAGNGRIRIGSAVTDSKGCASIRGWILGPAIGENRVVAEIPGLAPVFFEAQALPDERGGVRLLEGNHQFARVQAETPVPPSVLVVDSENRPASGRTVHFKVEGGGGLVSPETVVTDASGIARVTLWTLGSRPGLQSLVATVEGLPEVRFQATATSAGTPNLTREVVLNGLNHPWDIAFSPSGAMFYTLRSGTLHVWVDGQARQLAAPGDVNARSQSGLLGIAVDPQFAQNRFIYTYQSSNRSGTMDNRVRRWRVNEAYTQATEDRDILTGIPWGSEGGHSGGRLRFGPDGFLYVLTGDTRSATVPQNLAGLGSKVLRITRDGRPAPGNPDLGPGTRREIFAYGFRNPQGLAFRPGTNQVLICEYGPNSDDEVTRILPGGNGGWDPNDGAGRYNGYSGARMTDLSKFPQALRPAWVISDSSGMAGCDFVRGTSWKSWDGRLAVGFLATMNIRFVELDYEATSTAADPSTAFAGDARIRGVTLGPDGFLYVATDAGAPNGQIWRLRPQ